MNRVVPARIQYCQIRKFENAQYLSEDGDFCLISRAGDTTGTVRALKQPTKCKLCGCDMMLTKSSALRRPTCSACAVKQGRCSICRRPNDNPVFKTCAGCRMIREQQSDRIEARIGRRGAGAEWEIRQIERDQEFAAQLVEKFKEELHANG